MQIRLWFNKLIVYNKHTLRILTKFWSRYNIQYIYLKKNLLGSLTAKSGSRTIFKKSYKSNKI